MDLLSRSYTLPDQFLRATLTRERTITIRTTRFAGNQFYLNNYPWVFFSSNRRKYSNEKNSKPLQIVQVLPCRSTIAFKINFSRVTNPPTVPAGKSKRIFCRQFGETCETFRNGLLSPEHVAGETFQNIRRYFPSGGYTISRVTLRRRRVNY